MIFASPHIVVWLWMVPAVALFFLLCARSRERAMRRFARQGTLKEIAGSYAPRKKKARDIMMLAAFLFMILALMRPQWGFEWREVKRQGIDIMIALDTSNSMLAEDVRPNRLKRAKLAVRDLVRKLGGDRVGLITFAGTAFLQCPLTMDYNGFLMTLDDVDTYTIPIGGTSLTSAIYKAVESFESEIESEKILIIITDGEDHEGGLERAIQYAKARDLKIFSVGVGSSEGELIPVPGERGKEGFLRDAEGNVVRSRLNEMPLQRMALETGGMYVRGSGAGFGLDLIYEQELSKLQQREIGSRMEKDYNERFQLPLAVALLLLFIEPLIGDRKKNKESVTAGIRDKISKNKRTPRRRKVRKAITLISLLIMNLYCANVLAVGGSSAESLLREEKYDEALEKYEKALEKRPHDPLLEYNRAIILYHKGDMARAAEAFMRAGVLGEDEVERKAAYNVGNTKYRMGEFLTSKSPEMSIKGYNEALEYYKKAMELDPDDIDAKYNYEFTLNKLKEAENEQQEQEEQEDEQQEQQEQDQQQEQEEQEDEQKEQEEQEDQQQEQQEQEEQEDEQQEQQEQDQQQEQEEQEDQQQQEEEEQEDEQQQEEEEQEDEQQQEQQEQDQQQEQEQDDKDDRDEKKDPDKRDGKDERKEPRQPDQGPMYEEPVSPDLTQGGEDAAPGEMTEQQAMMLLNWQEEEENSMRNEMREDQRDERPPVLIDW
jgi:Ca-activated chloride channel homolog